MAYQCTTCSLEFPSSAKLSEHRRCVHQSTVRVTFGNKEQVTLERKNGTFECPCCTITYKNPNNLRGHVRFHLNPPEDSPGDPSDSPLEAETPVISENTAASPRDTTPQRDVGNPPENDAQHDSGLKDSELNCKINTTLRAVICLECRVCVGTDRLLSHLKNSTHQRKISRSKAMREVEKVIEPLELMTHLQIEAKGHELQRGPPGPPITDLTPPVQAYKCKACNVIRIDTAVWHSQRGCSEKASIKCHAQMLHTGVGRVYFEVLGPPPPPALEPDLFSRELEVLKEARTVSEDRVNDEVMATPPWLQRTQWLQYGGNGIEVAAKFARLTDAPVEGSHDFDALQPIAAATDTLLHTSLGLLQDVDVVTLQELRSPGESTSPRLFCAKQNPETHAKYFQVMTRLVCFLVRLHWLNEEDRTLVGAELDDETNRTIKDITSCAESPDLHAQLPDRILTLFIKRVLVQPFGLKRFSNLGVNFMCLLGYDCEAKVFRSPDRYTRYLAGLVFSFRLLCVRACFRHRDREVISHPEKGNDAFQAYFEHVKPYLKDSSRSVLGEALSLLAYGKVLSMDTLAVNKIHWDETSGYSKLSYKGQVFDIVLFKRFVQNQLRELSDLTSDLLLCANKSLWPELPATIYDIQSETALGWSYTADGRNNFSILTSHILRKVHDDAELKGRFYTPDGVLRYKQAQDYLDIVDRYLVTLAVTMHITGGQPPRGPEILTSRTWNTTKYQRNFYIWEGRTVVLAISYNKTMAFTGSAKCIYRFFPEDVGDSFLMFDLVIRPFASYLERKSGEVTKTPFLFHDTNGKPWKTDKLTAALSSAALADFGFKLKVSTYRQLAIAMTKKHLERFGVMVQRLKETAVEDSSFALQAGHNQLIRDSYYGIDAESMGSNEVVENSRIASVYWHFFLGVIQNLPDWIFQPPVLQQEMFEMLREKYLRLYGASGQPPLSLLPALLPQPAQPAGPQPLASHMPNPTATDIVAVPLQHLGSYTSPNPYPKQVLQALIATHGPGAKFKCDTQAEFARSLFLKHSPLLAVLPTSIGKTEAILIIMKVPGARITVIIEPYLATCEDVVKRATEKKIEVTFYRGTDEEGRVRLRAAKLPHLIVTTPEAAVTTGFQKIVSDLWARQQLDRIVLDECHQPILDEGFRKLDKLVYLSAIPTQLVFMTASLPPIMSGAFSDFTSLKKFITMRAPTNVKNVSYSVTVDSGFLKKVEGLVCSEVESIRAQGGKIVIFCRSKAQAMYFADLKSLKVLPFYSDLMAEERDVILTAFESLDECTVLAATTCWSAGYNAKNVLLGVFCGLPYSGADFVQQAGRVARQGQKGRVMVFCSKPAMREQNHLSRQPWRSTLYQGLVDFVLTKECRRLVLSQLNDGEPVECRTCNADLCDNCQSIAERGAEEAGHQPQPSIQEVRRAIAEKKQQQDLIIAALMQLGRGNCAACYLIGEKIIHVVDCPVCPYGAAFEEFSALFERQTNFCYVCFLPLKSAGCNPVEGVACCNREGPRGICWAVWQDCELRDRVFNYMGVWQAGLGIEHVSTYVQWLTNTINGCGEGDNNMWRLLCALQAMDFLPML